MPAYGIPQSGGVLTAVWSGDNFFFWNNESPVSPVNSVPVANATFPGDGSPAITFQASWSGSASLQVMGSMVDTPGRYVALGGPLATSPASYTDTGCWQFYLVQVASGSPTGLTVVART